MAQAALKQSPEAAPARPRLRIKARAAKRVLQGYPWVFSNDVEMNAAAKAALPGALADFEAPDGQSLGTGMFNRHALIAGRLLSFGAPAEIDAAFFATRLRRALTLRDRLIDAPCYRLIHAEADGLPGTVIDRFGDALVLQINTAGMERLLPLLLAALEDLLSPRVVVLRGDSPARSQEGLTPRHEVIAGSLDGPLELVENGARFLVDPMEGQKTGWFFDQRDNRAWTSRLAAGQRVLDAYAFAGGFTVQAALAGATEVLCLDRSQAALALAEQAAGLNGVAERCRFLRGEAFEEMQRLHKAGERFGLVIADPPAFVKVKKDLAQGRKGYRKMTRLAGKLVAPDGFLFVASCSHHMAPDDFAEQVRAGLADIGRRGRILRASGAAPDHPVHPALPGTGYLKALTLALD